MPLYVSHSISLNPRLLPGTFQFAVTTPPGDTRTFTCELLDGQGALLAEMATAGGTTESGPLGIAGSTLTAKLNYEGGQGPDVVIPLTFPDSAALDQQVIRFVWSAATVKASGGTRPLAELDPEGAPVVLSYDVPEPTSYRGRQIIELDFPDSYFVTPPRTAPLFVSHDFAAEPSLPTGTFRFSVTSPPGDSRLFVCRIFNEARTQLWTMHTIGGTTYSSPCSLEAVTGTTLTARLNYQGGNEPDIVVPLVFPGGTAAELNQRQVKFRWSSAVVATAEEDNTPSLYLKYAVMPDDSLPTAMFRFAVSTPSADTGTFTCDIFNDAGAMLWSMHARGEAESSPCALSLLPGGTLTARLNRQDSGLPDVVVPLAFPGGVAAALDRQRIQFTWSEQPLTPELAGGDPAAGMLLGAAHPGKRASELTEQEIAEKFRLARETAYFDPAVFPNVQGGDDAETRKSVIEALADLDEKTVVTQLMAGNRLTVFRDASGRHTHRFIPAPRKGAPALMLVEYYRLSSFPARYGAGRTIKTFSLLPGERTKIRVKSYRRSEKTLSQASSILDSTNDEVESEFERSVQAEQATQDNTSRSFEYHAEARAEVSARWGLAKVNASVSGGVKGSSNASREELAKNVSSAVAQNAARASSRRDVTVDTTMEAKEEQTEETAITRTLENVNVSRTLNFVFRQMNQEFVSLLHLVDVRVAFFNGFTESRHEVPLAELNQLLDVYIVEDRRAEVLGTIVGELRSITDHTGTVRDDFVDEPTENRYLRVNPASTSSYRVGRDGQTITVPGVIVAADSHVMRTDGIVVDAFLGRGNSLDEYSTGLQEQEVRARQLDNDRQQAELDRLRLAVQLVESGDAAGVELYQRLFPTLPVINHIGQASITGPLNGQLAKPLAGPAIPPAPTAPPAS
ncbi:hypothetical protein ACQEVF_48580 [Nonomuraea polychroma]|uniref:hypothetical protein n=1 Tax=Nonomuraea polychroma TaxID=46176 RepID=UPI003D93A4C1